MQDHPSRRLPLGLIAGFSVLILATGGGVAWWTWKSAPSNTAKIENPKATDGKPAAIAPDSSKTATSPDATTKAEQTLQVYWLTPTDTSFKLAPQPVQIGSNTAPTDLLTGAMQQLLSGPSNPTAYSTTVPDGTKLRDLTIKPDGIHLDLSKEFTQGGGSAAMTGRLAQVLYTVTSLKPNTPVWLSVDGKLVDTLGGEGLVLDQPLTREQFQKDFPF